MEDRFITVLVYRYKPYAPWLLAGYGIVTLILFMISTIVPPIVVELSWAVMAILPVIAALQPKSFFSVRTVDDRRLVIGSTNISWNGISMPVSELSDLDIYIYSFDDFKHWEENFNGNKMLTVEYGDQNKLSFGFNKQDFDFTFYLADFEEYDLLIGILGQWSGSGIQYSARSAFEDDFIREEVAKYS